MGYARKWTFTKTGINFAMRQTGSWSVAPLNQGPEAVVAGAREAGAVEP